MTGKGSKRHDIFTYAARTEHMKRKTARRTHAFSLLQIVKIRVTMKSSLTRSNLPNYIHPSLFALMQSYSSSYKIRHGLHAFFLTCSLNSPVVSACLYISRLFQQAQAICQHLARAVLPPRKVLGPLN